MEGLLLDVGKAAVFVVAVVYLSGVIERTGRGMRVRHALKGWPVRRT